MILILVFFFHWLLLVYFYTFGGIFCFFFFFQAEDGIRDGHVTEVQTCALPILFQPGIRKSIGVDLGAGFLWRPLLNENVLVEGGFTGLLPGAGFDDIYVSACRVP